jgi:hypothetical protein
MLVLSGCSSQLHTNTKSSNVLMTDVETIPMEVGVTVGEKISGVCEYSKFLFFTTKAPTRFAYGVDFEQASADFGGPCTNAAVYEAITASNADIIVAPRYFTEGKTFGCIPLIDMCISRDVKVTVKGLKGTYEDFTKVSPKLRELKIQSKAQSSKSLF